MVDLVAGGRVFTGLKAFSLNAPESLIRQIKGLDTPGVQPDRPVEVPEAVIATSPLAKVALKVLPTVSISEDQETSPFAPPEPFPSIAPSVLARAVAAAESNALAALSTSTPRDLVASTIPPPISGSYPIVLGPFGRGLVDGIGGIRDAAIYATELFIANGISGYKEDNPDASDDDAIAALLPDATFERGPNGEALMHVDGARLPRPRGP